MRVIKLFFAFRYQISRDLKAYTIVLFVVINGFLKRLFFCLKPHISTIFIAIDHDEKKNYEVSVWYGIKSRLQILKDFSVVVQ